MRQHKVFIISVLIGLTTVGCDRLSRPKEIYKFHEARELMTTVAQLDVCFPLDEKGKVAKAVEKVWERWDDIAWRMNVFDARSDVARINNAQGASVQVGEDTYALLKDSQHYKEWTWGAFDITIWPLVRLWKESAKLDQIPTSQEISAAREDLGVQGIEFLPSHHVRVPNPRTQIDLGGIAGGYAVDEGARILLENGFSNFLIDLGGDMYAHGLNCEGQRWRVGIRDPLDISWGVRR